MLTGNKLKHIRLYRSLKQQDLAVWLGVTKCYVSMLENEKQPIPEHLFNKWMEFLNNSEVCLKEVEKIRKSKKKK